MTEKSIQSDTLLVDDIPYTTELTAKYKNRKPWSQPDKRQVIAFLPGTVTQILVEKGDLVEEGQTVIRFEAMKMVNNVQSPVSGKVKEIYVKTGDRFSKGFVLIELTS